MSDFRPFETKYEVTEGCDECGVIKRWVKAEYMHTYAHSMSGRCPCGGNMITLPPGDPRVLRADLQNVILAAGGGEVIAKAREGNPVARAMLAAVGYLT